MIERIKRGAAMILAACILAVMLPAQTVYAANAKLAFSDPSATVGGQVSVNMKLTATGDEKLSTADVTVTYDANALEFISGTNAEGGSGKVRIHGDGGTPNTASMTFTLKFNARAAGTTKIEVSNQEIYDSDSQLVTLDKQGSSTVTVGALATASKDASLKSLKISPGSLTPEFSPNVDSYAVTVGMDVDKIIVSAEANDENATKVIKGNEGLQMGENRVTCLVTAQDGETTKEYVIVVTKAEGGATAADGSTGGPVKLSAAARTITIIEPDENTKPPAGFVETLVNIDGHKVKGWIWSSDKDRQYCVVYGMNEAGEKNFYRYDLGENEKTIQRYFQDPAVDTGVTTEKYETLATDYNNLLKDYNTRMIVIVILAVVAVILLILFIWQIFSKDKKGGPDHGPGNSRGSKRGKESGEAEEGRYDEEEYGGGSRDDEDMPEEGYDENYDEEAVTRQEAYDMTDLEAEDEDAPDLRCEPLRQQARNQRPARRPQGEAAGEYRMSPARGEEAGEYRMGSARGEEAGKRLPRTVSADRYEGSEDRSLNLSRSARQGAAEGQPERRERQGALEGQSERRERQGSLEGQSERLYRQGSLEGQPERLYRQGSLDGQPERLSRQGSLDGQPERLSRQGSQDGQPERLYRQGAPEGQPQRLTRQASPEGQPQRLTRPGPAGERPSRQGSPEGQPMRPAYQEAPDRQPVRLTRSGSPEGKAQRPSRQGPAGERPERLTRQGSPESQPQRLTRPGPAGERPERLSRLGSPEGQPQRPSRPGSPLGQSVHPSRPGSPAGQPQRPSRPGTEGRPVRQARQGGFENISVRQAQGYDDVRTRPSRSAFAGERQVRQPRSAAAGEQYAAARQSRPERAGDQSVRQSRPAAERPARALYPAAEEYPARSSRPAARPNDGDDDDFDLVDIE